jgi:peptidoglycan/xylan/chitin deacetylase (PgdA/CDA1 family)
VRGLNASTFEEHILFLKNHFDFVSVCEPGGSIAESGRTRILITFDDGFLNNVEVAVPILRKHRVPAVFFIATRHLSPQNWLWFTYLAALRDEYAGDRLFFRGELLDMSPAARSASMKRLREHLLGLEPHPAAMYESIARYLPAVEEFTSEGARRDRYAGMSPEQVRELAADPLFTIGAHTIDHPMLTRCEPDERRRQIEGGRNVLQAITGKPCELFAYPSDDHDPAIRRLCSDLGFRASFTIHRMDSKQPRMAVPRVGVYHPGLSELGFKVRWNGVLRQLQQWNLNYRN